MEQDPIRQYEAAEAAARRETERHPDRAAAWRQLGEALRDLWRLGEAEAAFLRATTLDSRDALAWSGLAGVQIARGQIEKGFTSSRQASRLRSDLAAPHRHRASAMLAMGRPEEAARAAAEARRLDPDAPEGAIILATAWFQGGLRAGARRLIDRTIAAHPESAEALITRALMHTATGDLSAADDDLKRALALKPWLPPVHAALARLRQIQGRLLEARQAIETAHRQYPESDEYLSLHLDVLESSGELAAALGMARDALRLHPASRPVRLRLAMLLLSAGDREEALRHIPAVLPTAGAAAAWEALAATWHALGRERERLTCLERSLAEAHSDNVATAIAQARFRLGEPEAALERLATLPATVPSLVLKSEVLARLNRADEAVAALEEADGLAPDNALVQMRLGILHRQRKNFEAAEKRLRRAVELAPREPATHEQLAILLSEAGRYDEALASLQKGLELAPASRTLRFNMAVLMARQKRWADAERGLRETVAAAPLNLSALGNLGRVLAEQQRHQEAADIFEQAIELAPTDLGARHGLLGALRSLRRHDEATRAAREWIADCPEEPHAWRALALALSSQGDPEAEEAALRMEALAPDNPLTFETRGLVALSLGRSAEALSWFDKGLALQPNSASLLVNRALALDEVEGLDASAGELEKALAIEPESEGAQMNLSLVLLRMGRFEEGWRLYESRGSALRGPQTLVEARKQAGKRIDLSNSSVLVRAEQGLGDTIHFMRYVPILAAEAREVTFQMQDQIAWMAWGIAPNVRVCGYRDPVPALFDYHVSLISLPGYYDTRFETIPGQVPYVTPDPRRVALWRDRLGNDGFKVGIVWHTNPAHGNIRRWIPLKYLVPLGELPGVRLISLQKYHGLDQLQSVGENVRVETLGENFDEGPDAFADTAAVLASLDLVVTIDTSMAHLAGAMARPVWVLLHRSSDWRWLTGRTDSPWYPTLRLFQQTRTGDWEPVAAELRRALEERLASGSSGHS